MSIYAVSSDKNILNVARATDGLDLNTRNQYFATILGWDAGYNNRGLYNTFIGYQTSYNAVNGSYNTCVGALAGYAVNDTSNIFVGHATGQNLESGKNNIFMGNLAGQNLNMCSNNILIGHRNTVASAPYANIQNNLAVGNFSKIGGHSNVTVGNGCSNLSTDSLVMGNSVVNMDLYGLAKDSTRNSIIVGNHIENYGSNVLIVNNIHNSNYGLLSAGSNAPKLVNFSNEYMNLNDALVVQRTWQPALSNQSKLTLQNDIVVLSAARNGLLEMQDGHIRLTPSPCNGLIQLNAEVCVRDRIHLSRCNYTDHHWDIYLDNRGSSNTSDLVMKSKNNTVVTFTDAFAAEQLNFTGKHRCQALTGPRAEPGMIVIATGRYCDLNGVEDVFIDEAIPVVDICRAAKDARAFGVVAGWEEAGTGARSYKLGHMEFSHPVTGAPRVIVNSHGEGGIWVCNANGALKNGDLITTSAVPGYGMRQKSGVVKNYTVAKITCDCTFQGARVVEVVHGGRRWRAAFVGCIYKF